MSRVLLVTSAEKGHVNPAVGMAQALLDLGHHVGWLCLPEAPPQLMALGVEVLGVPVAGSGEGIVTGGPALAALVRDEGALRAWIRGLLLDAVPEQVDPVRAVLREFRPDVVALDGMMYGAVIACHLEGVPWAGVSSALTLLEPPGLDIELLRTVRSLAQARRTLFASFGLAPDFRTCEALSPLLNVVFATAALVGPDAAVPPHTRLVGPSLPRRARGDETAFPWDRLDPAQRCVFVSFGSQISWQPELFRLLAEAAAPLEVQLVMSAGDLVGSSALDGLPGDVLALPYVPQLQLLPRVSVFVSHGGANSVMEGLCHGVPLLLLPVCNDQPVQAHFVTRAGAGLALDPRALDVERGRAALATLLHDGPHRHTAAAIAADYARHDGAAAAARAVAALVA